MQPEKHRATAAVFLFNVKVHYLLKANSRGRNAILIPYKSNTEHVLQPLQLTRPFSPWPADL